MVPYQTHEDNEEVLYILQVRISENFKGTTKTKTQL